jgi:hypothetical protein
MPEEWEWGLQPLSSTNPPTQEVSNYATRVGLPVSFIAINLLLSLLFFLGQGPFPRHRIRQARPLPEARSRQVRP